jgi:hypothetical protein
VKIFVSYSSEDRAIADALAVGLRQDGHEVFFDRDNLRAGEEYHARIRNDIDACDLFVFIITPGSVRSTSYALAELALARQRWPDPSGHVLPVLAKSTPSADIPPYLAAVTYVEGAGNLIAETLANVARIAQARRRTALVWFGVCSSVLVTCSVAAAWFWPVLQPAGSKSCFLSARIAKDSATGVSPTGLILDIVYEGATTSFLVSPEGTASIHVGPLGAVDAPWALELRSAVGDSVSRQPVRGCPTAARTYDLGEGLNVTLAPR